MDYCLTITISLLDANLTELNEFEKELLRGNQDFPRSVPRQGTWNAEIDYEFFDRNQRVTTKKKHTVYIGPLPNLTLISKQAKELKQDLKK